MKVRLVLFGLCVASLVFADPGQNSDHDKGKGKSVNLALRSNEATRDNIQIQVDNPDDKAMVILGVQATGGLYVKDFPKRVPAHGSDTITAIYVARPGGGSNTDLVRLLTDSGEQVITVDHGRDPVATLDKTALYWNVGETGSKSVQLTITGSATTPMAARASIPGVSTNITESSSGVYTITITPPATTDALRFPVFIDYNPSLPDLVTVIDCSIGIKPGKG